MSTHFAKQRPCRGMAGFKFRTRTKSKYDRPPPDNFLQQSQVEKSQKNRVQQGHKRGKSAGNQVRDPFQEKLTDENPVIVCLQITEEDVKKFYMQLMSGTAESHRGTHKLPLNEVIDFQEDVLRVRLATQNVQEALERLAEQRLQALVEDMLEDKQISPFTNGQKDSEVAAEILKQASRGGIQDHQKIISLVKQGKQQQLRLSAEGLLDIVTQQAIEGNYSQTLISGKSGEAFQLREGRDSIVQEVTISKEDNKQESIDVRSGTRQIEAMKLLTPIVAEASQGTNTSINKQEDHRRLSSPGTKLRSAQHIDEEEELLARANSDECSLKDADQIIRKPVQKIASATIEGEAAKSGGSVHHDFQKMVNPPSPRDIRDINTKRSGQKLSRQPTNKSIQSKKTSGEQSSPPKLRNNRKTTMSHENLRSNMTPQVLEPRSGDNEDLKMLVGGADGQQVDEDNELSQVAQKGERLTTGVDGEDKGQIELKLSEEDGKMRVSGRFRARLMSAGANKVPLARKGSAIESYQAQEKQDQQTNPNYSSLVRYGIFSVKNSRAAIPEQLKEQQSATILLSKARARQQNIGGAMLLKSANPTAAGPILVSDDSNSNEINLSRNEFNELKRELVIKQINTLLRSDESGNTMELQDAKRSATMIARLDGNLTEEAVTPVIVSPPSVDQLINNGQEQPGQDQASKANTTQKSGQNESQDQIQQQKVLLQRLLEEEIGLLKEKNERPETPQLAYLDPVKLRERGYDQSPEKSLRVLEETMREHFKYAVGESANIGRPILSTRQAFSSQVQQKVFEQKILDTLKTKNQHEKYQEFVSAQQLAAAMMDIVSSTKSNNDIMMEPRLDQTKEMNKTIKSADGEELAHRTFSAQDDVTLENTQSRNITSQRMSQQKSNKSFSGFKKKKVTIEVRKDDPQMRDGIYSPTQGAGTARMSSNRGGRLTPEKQYKVPSQLNLEEQENVSTNIEQINKKLGESRKKMMIRRESRADTLNQLTSPKELFSLAKPQQASANNVACVNPRELVMSTQGDSSVESPKSPLDQTEAMNRVKSANVIGRKRSMKTQGGGFNRTITSGYFKGKSAQKKACVTSRLNKTMTHIQGESKLAEISSHPSQAMRHAFIEDRPPILANEVWESQNRGMPLKMMIQVQRPPEAVELSQATTSTPQLAYATYENQSASIAINMDLLQKQQQAETKIEVYPFERRDTALTSGTGLPHTQMEFLARREKSDSTNRHPEPIAAVATELSCRVSPDQPAEMASQGGLGSKVNSAGAELADGSLAAANEQSSVGQHTASNNVIIDHRYSKYSKTHAVESTVHLRASSTVGQGLNIDTTMVQKIPAQKAAMQDQKVIQRRIRNREHRSSPDFTSSRRDMLLQKLSSQFDVRESNNPQGSEGCAGPPNRPAILRSSEVDAEDYVRVSGDVDLRFSFDGKVVAQEESLVVGDATPPIDVEGDFVQVTPAPGIKEVTEEDSPVKTQKSILLGRSKPASSRQSGSQLEHAKAPADDTASLREAKPDKNTEPLLDRSHPRRRSVLQKAQANVPPADGLAPATLADSQDFVASQGSFETRDHFRAQLAPKELQTEQVLVQDLGEDVGVADGPQDEGLQQAEAHETDPGSGDENVVLPPKEIHTSEETPLMPRAERAIRPKTSTIPALKSAYDQMHLSASQPRQVIYRNGKLIQTVNASDHVARPVPRTNRNRQQTVGPKITKPSSRALNSDLTELKSAHTIAPLAANTSKMAQPGKLANQSMVGGTQSLQPPIQQQPQVKKDYARLTFTQGVSQLIRNFDKKFIVENVSLPRPFQPPTISKQIALKERPSANVTNPNETKAIIVRETAIHFSEQQNMDAKETQKDIAEDCVKELGAHARDPMQTLLREGGTSLETPERADGNEKPEEAARPKLRSGQDLGGFVLKLQQSPVFTTKFDERGLTVVNSAVLSPEMRTNYIRTQGASPKSAMTGASLKTRGDSRGKTTRVVSKQTKVTQPTTRSASNPGTTAYRVQRPQQSHPLEFLAQAAMKGNMHMDEASSRHGGLILEGPKRMHEDADYALSEQAQNIVKSLNSSRILHEDAAHLQDTLQAHGAAFQYKPSRESLLELRRTQRQNRQQVIFGTATIKSSTSNQMLPHKLGGARGPVLKSGPSLPQSRKLSQVDETGQGCKTADHTAQHSRRGEKELPRRPVSVPRRTLATMSRAASIDSTNIAETATVQKPEPSLASSSTLAAPEKGSAQSKPTSGGRPPVRGKWNRVKGKETRDASSHQQALRSLEKYTRTGQPSGPALPRQDPNKINLTQGDIDLLFKDLSRTSKNFNKSSVVVMGTQLKQQAGTIAGPDSSSGKYGKVGPNSIIGRRRVQSGNNPMRQSNQEHRQQQAQFRAGETFSKRSSMLFHHTVGSTTQKAII